MFPLTDDANNWKWLSHCPSLRAVVFLSSVLEHWLNLLSNFLDSRSFNFDDFASVVSRASVIQVKRWPGRFLTLYSLPCISYLVSVLQPISTNCFSVKDSFSFAEWAKQFTLNGEFMCSFDVSWLLTNVPLDETIEMCIDKFANLSAFVS